ncbi:DUF1850 domain-containing protein [Nitratireductor pacificus]|uniref:DUF1850 domain-containing protein n=1 Tax=Nitratireductor pacificus pht-3B TaxID=391937 RepID=K2LN87_9HYPH|nr:DUF1850 domain-containing protein [Nitratireductor pacificus]EKF19219.1 hypothetical protein NA2_08816 [Nitratireductor pacificus pht-3B]
MSLCVLAGGKAATIAATLFTLSWTHSVEKIRWEEDWRVSPAGLEIVEARVQGSGAGMEPPPEARFSEGWWRYRPPLPPQAELVLAASGATGSGWRLCAAGTCHEIGAEAGKPVILRYCG